MGSVLSREDFTQWLILPTKKVFFKNLNLRLSKLMRLMRLLVKDIYDSRAVLVKIASESKTVLEIFQRESKVCAFLESQCIRWKVDNITGFALLKILFLEEIIMENDTWLWVEIKRPLIITERDTPIPIIWYFDFAKRETHCLVVDE